MTNVTDKNAEKTPLDKVEDNDFGDVLDDVEADFCQNYPPLYLIIY